MQSALDASSRSTFLWNRISAHQSDPFETVVHAITQCAFVLITHQASARLLGEAHKTVCV